MQNLSRYVSLTTVASEITHLFCCGLPMIFSLISLLTSVGLVASMPNSINILHEAMHPYEVPLIITSAIIMLIGWIIHFVAERINCQKTGECDHEPCLPKKKRSNKILIIATFLFIFNLTGYLVLHS